MKALCSLEAARKHTRQGLATEAANGNALQTLGIRPALGQLFSQENSVEGQNLVVVLSNAYCRLRFAGEPSIIGESIRIDGIVRRIIGVLPRGVHFPYAYTQFLTPIAFKGGDPIDAWNDFNLRAGGRNRELSIRTALGASASRLVRQILLRVSY